MIREKAGAAVRSDGSLQSSPDEATTSSESVPAGTFDPDLAETLSSEPGELRDQLIDRAECSSAAVGDIASACIYREIVNLFTTYVVRPDLASAIWTVLAEEDGLVSLGAVRDRVGRPGIGIALNDNQEFPNLRPILIISTNTGQLLGQELLLTKDDPELKIDAPAVLSFSAILTASRTASVPPT